MTAAWGRGLATITDDGVVLDTWFRELGLGDEPQPEQFEAYSVAERTDDAHGDDRPDAEGKHEEGEQFPAPGLPEIGGCRIRLGAVLGHDLLIMGLGLGILPIRMKY